MTTFLLRAGLAVAADTCNLIGDCWLLAGSHLGEKSRSLR